MSKSDLIGKRVKRSRETSPFIYRFSIDGHKFQGTTGTTDKVTAEAYAEKKFQEASAIAAKERQLNNVPMTFGMACDKWLTGKATRLREQGLQEQAAWLRKQIGDTKLLQNIRKGDISAMVAARAKCLRPGIDGTFRRIADSTVNKTTRLMQRILNYAESNHDAIVKRFAWKDFFIKLPKARPAKRAVSPANEQIILGTIAADYLDLARFAIIGGLRASENLLLWDQVDWGNNKLLDVVGKGHREGRDVPMGPAEMAILRAQYNRTDRHPTHVFTYVAKKTGKIPRTDRSTIKDKRYPITYAGWKSEWEEMQQATGLKVRIHDLRHTAVTRALQRTNGNLPAVRDMVGHADGKTTLLYWDGDEQAVRDAKDIGFVPKAVPKRKKTG